jgi:hypothetical protein
MNTYRVLAYNTAHASENKIHDDAVAQKLGFSGALVPGVEMYAYMMHLPVERWGRAFLERGWAECRFSNPVYDGEIAEVSGSEANGILAIDLRARGSSSAIGSAGLPVEAATAPSVDGYSQGTPPAREHRPAASPKTLSSGAVLSTVPLEVTAELAATYLRDVREADALYARESLVHPGIVLRMCNQVLLQNVLLGPWIHVGSRVQNFGVARVGDTLVAHARVADNYERKGHLFVDLDVLVLSQGTHPVAQPVAQVRHTAIYRPRQLAVA